MRTIPTPVGDARVAVAAAPDPRATLVLGHGAGGGIDARDLQVLACVLPQRGVSVLRVEQPWRVAGRRVAAAPPTLDVAWLAVLGELAIPSPLVVGGRSAGARVACRTAAELGAAGCVALAFPLHPPGRPEKSRLPELARAGVPTLVVQGERDAFGGPAEFPAGYDVRGVPRADHAFRVRKGHDQGAALDLAARFVGDWVLAASAPAQREKTTSPAPCPHLGNPAVGPVVEVHRSLYPEVHLSCPQPPSPPGVPGRRS